MIFFPSCPIDVFFVPHPRRFWRLVHEVGSRSISSIRQISAMRFGLFAISSLVFDISPFFVGEEGGCLTPRGFKDDIGHSELSFNVSEVLGHRQGERVYYTL
uniref:Uncharacterized protein n=1 Tax=Compsopogon caeruleus TaxID=31354 RepID=A0A7S1TFP2_9RHOD|mmetsp:Transcript_5005/g.10097  ORF Transcript_5005/g.10097 Transcript_5005/m.10097 type:complete len:102 (+) Transcript_5005:878-1183(+)